MPSNSEQDDEEGEGHGLGWEEVLRADPIEAQEFVRLAFARGPREGRKLRARRTNLAPSQRTKLGALQEPVNSWMRGARSNGYKNEVAFDEPIAHTSSDRASHQVEARLSPRRKDDSTASVGKFIVVLSLPRCGSFDESIPAPSSSVARPTRVLRPKKGRRAHFQR